MERGPISKFITHHYRHFNSATLVDAAKAYNDLMNRGGKMMLAMAGAMSTAELILHRIMLGQQPRGGHHEPRRTLPLQEGAQLP